jgi:thiol-disulfide isomerase/thioredoxin
VSFGATRFFPKAFVPTLAALLLLASCTPPARAEADPPSPLRSIIRPGEKAPGFVLKDLDGKSVAFRPGSSGKPALIVFWSVFCPLCKELTPATAGIAERNRRAIDVIGVNLDGKRFSNAVRSFLKEYRMTFPVGLDDIRNDLFIASDPYGVEKTPTAVLVDAAGRVHRVYVAERMRDLVGNFEAESAALRKKAPPRKK